MRQTQLRRKPAVHMLRISKKADYAVFLLGAIARQGAFPGGPAAAAVVSAHEIARQAGLNKSVVANLLKEYARHGLLESVRGLKGGYRLVRPPAEISLQQILTVVDGPFQLVDCLRQQAELDGHAERATPERDDSGQCSLIGFCPSKNPMRLVHERILGLFAGIRLDELAGMVPLAHAPSTQHPHTPQPPVTAPPALARRSP